MAGSPTARRRFKKKNGPGPWPCHFCKDLVQDDELTVHHLDEVHDNHDPYNLTACHFGCHSRHHRLGKKQSQETKDKRAATHRGMKRSPEATENIRRGVKQSWADGKLSTRRKEG